MNNFFNYPSGENIPTEFDIHLINQKKYLVDGVIKEWSGVLRDVTSPVCIKENGSLKRRLIGRHPLLSVEETLIALEAAVNAYNNGRGQWPTMTVEERIGCIKSFAEKMQEKRDEIVKILMWEIGKSFNDSQKEFDRTILYILDTIDAIKDLDRISSRFVIHEGITAQIRRAPLGVALCMGPFNYPLNETFATLIPALIMGNSVILKPPKHGVLLYEPLLEPFRDSFPKGVINILYGEGSVIVKTLMQSGKIDVLAFIGSSKVADILKKQHPNPHRLRCVLGLGAKNPAIILKDADLDVTIKESVAGALSFNGQRCTALKIFFVHNDLCNEFIERFSMEISALKIGMPWEDRVNITPLAEVNKPLYFNELIEDAKKFGAAIINENGGIFNETLFYPALLFPVNEKMRIYHEEQFGPVIPIVPYNDIEEPVQYVINSSFGQQLSVFGRNSDDISRLIDPLVNQVCRLNINCLCQRGPDTFPFTGRKDSAEGTLSVSDALRVFSIRSVVAAKQNNINNEIIKEIIHNRKSKFLSTDFIL